MEESLFSTLGLLPLSTPTHSSRSNSPIHTRLPSKKTPYLMVDEMITDYLMERHNATDPSGPDTDSEAVRFENHRGQDSVLELTVACMNNNRERVMQMLDRGADPNAENANGKSALDVANSMGRVNIIKCLFRDLHASEAGLLELLKAFRDGRATVVQALLEMGVAYQLEESKLHEGVFLLACAIGTTHTVQAFYDHGPRINIAPFEDIIVMTSKYYGKHETADLVEDIAREQRYAANNTAAAQAAILAEAQAETFMLPEQCLDDDESKEEPITEFVKDASLEEFSLDDLFE